MTFPIPAPGRPAKRAVTYVGSTENTSDLTTYTFTGHSIGTASGDRRVAVCIVAQSGSARTISSVTVAGVTAANVVTANNTSGGADIAAIYVAEVAAGTTGDIAVTFSGAMLRCRVAVYRLNGGRQTAAASTATDMTFTSTNLDVTVNIPAGGSAIGITYGHSDATNVTSLTNLTSDDGGILEVVGNGWRIGSRNDSAAQNSLNILATHTANVSNGAFAVAVWGP